MRYYLEYEDQQLKVDLINFKRLSQHTAEFLFQSEGKELKVFVRNLAGKYYLSHDGVGWKRVVKQNLPASLLHVDKHYQFYRGYRPSGLMKSEEGVLLTKMPGRVVKILVKEGEQVQKGQTLLILEAMKMENEIKSNAEGVVARIHIQEGQALEQGVLLLEVE